MPDPGHGRRTTIGRWRWLGRLLPRDVRERVFDPAYADVCHRWLTAGTGGVPFGIRVLGTWVGCVPIAIPRAVYRNGRLTRTGRFVVWGGAAAVLVGLVVANLTRGYVAY